MYLQYVQYLFLFLSVQYFICNHRVDEFPTALQPTGATPPCISLKLRHPVFTARIQPVEPFPSINDPSDATTAFFFHSAFLNLMIAYCSGQLVHPQMCLKLVGALSAQTGDAGGLGALWLTMCIWVCPVIHHQLAGGCDGSSSEPHHQAGTGLFFSVVLVLVLVGAQFVRDCYRGLQYDPGGCYVVLYVDVLGNFGCWCRNI